MGVEVQGSKHDARVEGRGHRSEVLQKGDAHQDTNMGVCLRQEQDTAPTVAGRKVTVTFFSENRLPLFLSGGHRSCVLSPGHS